VENLGEWGISFFSLNFREREGEREREREKRSVLFFFFLFVCLFLLVLGLGVGASLCSFVVVQKLTAERLALFSAFLGFWGLRRSFGFSNFVKD
jgi:hypothetical protein